MFCSDKMAKQVTSFPAQLVELQTIHDSLLLEVRLQENKFFLCLQLHIRVRLCVMLRTEVVALKRGGESVFSFPPLFSTTCHVEQTRITTSGLMAELHTQTSKSKAFVQPMQATSASTRFT
jgi:hypothetical protein